MRMFSAPWQNFLSQEYLEFPISSVGDDVCLFPGKKKDIDVF